MHSNREIVLPRILIIERGCISSNDRFSSNRRFRMRLIEMLLILGFPSNKKKLVVIVIRFWDMKHSRQTEICSIIIVVETWIA
jgi:hypothetical protein